jgi:hypothetical protein
MALKTALTRSLHVSRVGHGIKCQRVSVQACGSAVCRTRSVRTSHLPPTATRTRAFTVASGNGATSMSGGGQPVEVATFALG